MSRQIGLAGIFSSGAAMLMAIQPAWGATTLITAVQLSPSQNGIEVMLKTAGGNGARAAIDRSQVMMGVQGNTWTADIQNVQLQLPDASSFSQNQPAPGISSVVVLPLNAQTVRVMVIGQSGALTGQMTQQSGNLVFRLNRATQTSVASGRTLPPPPGTTQAPASPPAPEPSPEVTPVPDSPEPTPQPPAVMVPNPSVTITGTPATPQTIPPSLPRAIVPPVGDIATATTDAGPRIVDLGTSERISRLVLRDTPARDVLALLVRAAGLNFAYTGAPTGDGAPGQQVVPPAIAAQQAEGPKVTIDLEDESIQSAFNSILQLSNLEANRVGRTVYVGPRLSNLARDAVVRTLRLNQINVGVAINYLVAMGAESAISRERQVTTVNAVPVGATTLEGGVAATPGTPGVVTETRQATETRVETQRIAFQDSQPLLRGLQVVGDERTNSVTLVGNPRNVTIAANQLTMLDSRKRQVIINVRIVDVNLLATSGLSSSFSFGVNKSFFVNDAGALFMRFGEGRPPIVNPTFTPGSRSDSSVVRPGGTAIPSRILAELQLQVQTGSAKILTDPTLTVQEGQTAQVNLVEEVFGGLRLQQSSTGAGGVGSTIQTQEPIIKQAGLILSIKVDRIDDNGFVALSVAPTVSVPGQQVSAGTSGTITLLQQRSFTSGQIRLRDGQTLILSGIIQDQDRVTASKIPLLGDIPILGALFRSTRKSNARQEVIVLLTPQIMDDSDRATAGYGYTPSPDASPLIQRDRFLNPRQKP